MQFNHTFKVLDGCTGNDVHDTTIVPKSHFGFALTWSIYQLQKQLRPQSSKEL